MMNTHEQLRHALEDLREGVMSRVHAIIHDRFATKLTEDIMNTLTTKWTIRRQRFSISVKRMVLATLCFIVMMSAARTQQTRLVEPVQRAQEQPDERETKAQDAEAPINGLLQVSEQPPPQPRVAVRDAELVFGTPAPPPTSVTSVCWTTSEDCVSTERTR